MKITEKMKRFFTLNAARSEGFTLVELIVVIAILAILAGVAIPAYSGYIEKSKRAGDETLLAAVNDAFASACVMNGSDIWLETSAVAPLTADKAVDIAKVQPYGADFATFFEGNTGAKFEVFSGIYFDPDMHMFVEGIGLKYVVNGTEVYIPISKEQADALGNSTFMDASKGLGTEGLLDQLGMVTNFASQFVQGGSDAFTAVLGDPKFQASFMNYLGITDPEEFDARMNELEAAGGTEDEILANAAVIFAAQNAASMDKNTISALLSSENTTNQILSSLGSGNANDAMAQAALAYGMYTAYAYNNGNQDLIDKTKNPIDVLNALDNDTAFKEYIDSEQGKKDLEGYMAGMGMIADGTKDSDVAGDLLVNGFDNEQLAALLNQSTGK